MATSSYIRRLNQRRIIESVARLGTVSRVELARLSGMSQPTVSRIVDRLLSRGILVEAVAATAIAEQSTDGQTRASAGVGRPSTPLELDRRKPRFAVVQLGVRKTRLAVLPIAIPGADRWTTEFDMPTRADEWSRALAAAWEPHRTKGVKTIVVSLPGVVDENTGRVFLSPNLRWTEQADLGDVLKSVFGTVKILFSQEIRALALGHLAMEPTSGDFLLVDSGSGVGAAAVANGTLYTGPLPLSGEIGHTPVLGNKRVCGCGSVGCLETLISRPGLLASAAEHGERETWSELVASLVDRPMPAWLKKTLDHTAVTIAAALNMLGLRQVVLTGAFAEFPQPYIEYLSEAIRADAMWARFGSIVCRTAARHRQAGLVSLAIDRTLLDAPLA